MDRVFLDANVLYSAAWRQLTGLRMLWTLDGVTLMTSSYAIHEAKRNLHTLQHHKNLDELVDALLVVKPHAARSLPAHIQLPVKDRPILRAAIAGNATHLLTGDRKHFGRYFEQVVEGVLIQLPAMYLKARN